MVLRLDKVTTFAEPGLLLKGRHVKNTKTAATKNVRLPKHPATDRERAKYFSSQLDPRFPKVDLREVLGDELAYTLLMHADLISQNDRDTLGACVQFVVRQAVAVEMEGMKSDPTNLVGSTLEWDEHARGLKKGGAR